MKQLTGTLALGFALMGLPLQASDGGKDSRVDELKDEIVAIASANTSRVDNFSQVRMQLQPLVDELLAISTDRSEAEKINQVEGAWRNLWSDLGFGPGTNYEQVYQVVSRDGYYYNISESRFGVLKFTGFLRGAYTDEGDFLAIEFTNNDIRFGFPEPGTDLVQLATDFEEGQLKSLPVPGPIGVTGVLINAYVDDELRIVTGNNSGEMGQDLFILERVDSILP
ncbi:hypothetical protein [Pseudobacteriovorax antillogorgiicola]|uniref:Plastid lipid-associated protein/fibrillin conserved domain-containing protein n=1 Tax=Pseudobacteriovorax antillogorgiicola TaxID=1513793 RepID=A0A1Y6CBG0_9BACT|nr:hypothetical protein [Pseudobacteriovorax antillogorgiicola]TCS48703.1 hypothetical protein EDD56_117125 [Pseudobacteriovorax antillogorgiicola]SMF54700.1 hypothetical protein SAMN06296036_11734 [Pseudobacteriovorax antillogorgiicola]